MVSFAHYTVWEFLASTRLLSGPAAVFSVNENVARLFFIKSTTILGALRASPVRQIEWEQRRPPSINIFQMAKAMDENFDIYCFASSSILLLTTLEVVIAEEDDLRRLVFDLLNLSMPHFRRFQEALLDINFSGILYDLEEDCGVSIVYGIGQVLILDAVGSTDSEAMILLNLIVRKRLELAQKLLETSNIERLMRTSLYLEIVFANLEPDRVVEPLRYFQVDGCHRFRGSIVESCLYVAPWIGVETFKFLLSAALHISTLQELCCH